MVLGLSGGRRGGPPARWRSAGPPRRRPGPFARALFEGKDPTIPLVLLEDISALVGLTIALTAVGLAAITRNGVWDALGSIVIGALLMVVAVLIARDTHSLLIGDAPPRDGAGGAATAGGPRACSR